MKFIYLSIIIGFFSIQSLAQVSGNQVYSNNSTSYNNYSSIDLSRINHNKISLTDSSIQINVRVLMNKAADSYQVTFATNQEAKTLTACNREINERICNFITGLSKFSIKEEDCYVDFVSQTKVYDYEVSENSAQQFEDGFEIKKNILIKFTEISDLDELIELAASQQIYDLVKVEYIDHTMEKTYEEMYKAAFDLIKSRLKLYTDLYSIKVLKTIPALTDNFYAIFPKSQYKSYQAFESSQLDIYRNNYGRNYVQKEARKHRTFYYEGVSTSGFDKVINPNKPEIGLQYVFMLSVQYELEH